MIGNIRKGSCYCGHRPRSDRHARVILRAGDAARPPSSPTSVEATWLGLTTNDVGMTLVGLFEKPLKPMSTSVPPSLVTVSLSAFTRVAASR